MTTRFDPTNLPRHIHVARAGRGEALTPMAALTCSVCGDQEESVDNSEALREVTRRFVPRHMDCAPITNDFEVDDDD